MNEAWYWIIGLTIFMLGFVGIIAVGISSSSIESTMEVDCNIGELVYILQNADNLTEDMLLNTSNCKISGSGKMPAYMVKTMLEMY